MRALRYQARRAAEVRARIGAGFLACGLWVAAGAFATFAARAYLAIPEIVTRPADGAGALLAALCGFVAIAAAAFSVAAGIRACGARV
jgi:hypothetical protein